jgi:hypothetical protein
MINIKKMSTKERIIVRLDFLQSIQNELTENQNKELEALKFIVSNDYYAIQ